MGTSILETKRANGKVFRIVLLDDKYTVYIRSAAIKGVPQPKEEKFSAVASFDNLMSARKYVEEKSSN